MLDTERRDTDATPSPELDSTWRPSDVREPSGHFTPTADQLILVVDDDGNSAQVLERIVRVAGHRPVRATCGSSALEIVARLEPALVLLDVHMPGLDGLEVCRLVKKDPATRSIPVVLVTAHADPGERVAGLEAGADDFVVKPVAPAELVARMRTHLRLKRLLDEVYQSRDSLHRKNQELLRLGSLRTDLVNMVVHDLKNPLTALQLSADALAAITGIPPGGALALSTITECVRKLEMLVANILDVSRIESAELHLTCREVQLEPLVATAVADFRAVAEHEQKHLTVLVEPDLPSLVGDAGLIARVIENLVSNALRLSAEGGVVAVGVEQGPGGVALVSVADRGPGVADDMRLAIFDKFATSSLKRSGIFANHGLGLTFCKLAIEAHGGRIWVEPREGGGSVFRFTLPRRPRRRPAPRA